MKSKTFIGILSVLLVLFCITPSFSSPVPDTGVTKCYNATTEITCPSSGQAFYGQDASYTINPMSYTKLDASGNALPDWATSWTMVKDTVTGLIWEMKTNKDGVKNYNDPHDADNTYTWYDSNPATNGGNAGTPGDGTDTEDFIKALNDAKHGGFSDWRLPTIKELAYIVNYSVPSPGPTINTDYFPNTVASGSLFAVSGYWSSTTYAGSTSSAWCVGFGSGGVSYGRKDGDYYVVRAVRGGSSGSLGNLVIGSFDSWVGASIDKADALDNYTDNGNGTVTDNSMKLMWQQTASSNQMAWEQALAYCEGLTLGGHTDWRLPTIKELRSLVDYSRTSPAINTTYFPNTVASGYWSATTNAGGGAWLVNFSLGYDNYYYKGDELYVRAVRGGQSGSLGNLVISPSSRTVTKDAGSTTFSVSNTGTGTMQWTAVVASGSDWLRITSGASGTNSGTISCAYNANNTTTYRTATITVTAPDTIGSPKVLTVAQTGYPIPTPTPSASMPVPDTGITKCYSWDGFSIGDITCPTPGQDYYGQDANYSINPMSFTKLDATGHALPDWGDTTFAMVKDNVTGLIWEVKTNKDGAKNYNDPHDADNDYTWYDSNPATNGGYSGKQGDGTDTEDFIKALNNAKYGGFSDWRLPTVRELMYIVNFTDGSPDSAFFPNMVTASYWSSTTHASNPLYAWYYNIKDKVDGQSLKSGSGYVCAVRGAQFVNRFIDNGDKTITDTTTGLMWQKESNDPGGKWKEALSYCEGLSLGNFLDWRLPNIKELLSLVDYTRHNPAIDTTYFSTSSDLYWTSSTLFVSFDIGNSHGGSWMGGRVRAVRGKTSIALNNLVVDPESRNLSKDDGATTFKVSNSGTGTMLWNAKVTPESDWFFITSGDKGTNTGTITCEYLANPTASARTATIRVTATDAPNSPKDVKITQAGTSSNLVISGSVKTKAGAAIPSVTITFSNNGGTATTDANGNYTGIVPRYGYSGTATPSKSGYTFTPATRTYTNVVTNQTGQNYTGIDTTTVKNLFLGVWSDGVWTWDKSTGKWSLISSTGNTSMIAAGKVDTDTSEDLIGVWPSGLYVKLSSTGEFLKLSTKLPTWIAVGDLNNDGRDDVIGTWAGDGTYYRNSVSGNWVMLTSPAKQLAAGNIGGSRDDLAGVWADGLWVRYSANNTWKNIDKKIPIWITVGDITGDNRADIIGSYSTGTWYQNSATGSWTKLTSSASQLAAGDLDGDGKDDLIGIWPGGVYVRYAAGNGQWQLISSFKPKWITTGKMTEAILSAGSLEDPEDHQDFIDLSAEGPGGSAFEKKAAEPDGPEVME